MITDHERIRTALGPYVLGALSHEEETEVDVHLATCAECRAELDELQPAAALLAEARDLAGDGAAPAAAGAGVLYAGRQSCCHTVLATPEAYVPG